MAYVLEVSLDAELDMRRHILFLEGKEAGLSSRFEYFLDLAMQEVESDPLNYQIRYRNVRIHFTEVFSYGIHYVVIGKYIKVVAIFHTSEDPADWPKGSL